MNYWYNFTQITCECIQANTFDKMVFKELLVMLPKIELFICCMTVGVNIFGFSVCNHV